MAIRKKFKDLNESERKRKISFAVFLLIVGGFWLAKDMGYVSYLPFWPLVVILFALFLLFTKM